jgi:hypothetical protein
MFTRILIKALFFKKNSIFVHDTTYSGILENTKPDYVWQRIWKV